MGRAVGTIRRRQGELQSAVAKGARDVEHARRQIQALNTGETAAVPPPEEPDEAQQESQPDTEEEKLRLSLHQALTACEQSLGPAPQAVEPQFVASDGEGQDGQGQEGARKKRAAEPKRSA